MTFINKVLGKLLGNKSERDIKEVGPIVAKIKEEYERIVKLSNDGLREESTKIKNIIREKIQPEEEEIEKLKVEVEEVDIQFGEKIYEKIDKLEEEINVKLEEVLNEVLPATFALVKETARRFVDYENIEVTANDFDRDLAATRNSIIINGDKAVWKNRWMAGGSERRSVDWRCCFAPGKHCRNGNR